MRSYALFCIGFHVSEIQKNQATVSDRVRKKIENKQICIHWILVDNPGKATTFCRNFNRVWTLCVFLYLENKGRVQKPDRPYTTFQTAKRIEI